MNLKQRRRHEGIFAGIGCPPPPYASSFFARAGNGKGNFLPFFVLPSFFSLSLSLSISFRRLVGVWSYINGSAE